MSLSCFFFFFFTVISTRKKQCIQYKKTSSQPAFSTNSNILSMCMSVKKEPIKIHWEVWRTLDTDVKGDYTKADILSSQ